MNAYGVFIMYFSGKKRRRERLVKAMSDARDILLLSGSGVVGGRRIVKDVLGITGHKYTNPDILDHCVINPVCSMGFVVGTAFTPTGVKHIVLQQLESSGVKHNVIIREIEFTGHGSKKEAALEVRYKRQ